MNVKECYKIIDGDYQEIMRLLVSEERVIKYLLKFKEDQCMDELTKALDEKRYEDAFRYAHTLKGVSINLMMKKLVASSSALTDALRQHETAVEKLYDQVREDYNLTISTIDNLMKDM